MTFGQFISIILARWKLVSLVILAAVAAAVVGSLLMPPQYTAKGSIVFDIKPDPLSIVAFGGMTSPAYMSTQVDILRSDRVARRVVSSLGLGNDAASRNRWLESAGGRGDFEAWMAGMLLRNLVVRPERESNVINISYEAEDPKVAALVANAFMRSYMDTVLDLRVDPARQYSSFFDARGKELRDQLERAQTRLSAYQRQKGLVATDERLDVETARLNELSAQVVALQAISAESSSRQVQARGQAANSLQDVLTNPVISGLKADLSRNEARLQELSARLGDNHPLLVEARANSAELRARIEAETRRVASGVGLTNTINRQREAEIRAAFEAQRQRVLRLKEQRDEAAVIQREVENAQRAYDGVLARYNQTSLESQATQTNAALLTSASEPTKPSSPNLLLNSAIALFLGAGAAVSLALMLEVINRRVRSIDDLGVGLGLDVVGVLPGPDATGLFGRSSQPLLARRVLGQLPMSGPKGA